MYAGSSSSRSGRRRSANYAAVRPATSRAACAFLRAAVFACSAPLRGGLVDPAHERAVLGGDRVGVAGVDGGLEALRQRLDRRAEADVLHALALGRPDALLLLLDVRHIEKRARGTGERMVATGALPMLTA